MSDSVRPQRRQPTSLSCPWDSPGKNTVVGCHFLLQCMKVKRQSEVAQSCLTLSDPMDCSPPGSSVHGILQARILVWGAIAFSQITLILPHKSLSVLYLFQSFSYLDITVFFFFFFVVSIVVSTYLPIFSIVVSNLVISFRNIFNSCIIFF